MASINVVMHRRQWGETFVIGDLNVDGTRIGSTLEYPWRHDAKWAPGKKKAWNFFHTSCVREGIYPAQLRGDHRTHAGAVQWRVEIMNSQNRIGIEFHAGNSLIRDSEGCILCGDHVHHVIGVEPRVEGSRHAMERLVHAIFGKTWGIRTTSQWATMMRDLKITVRVIGMPPDAWKIE
jgi:hypothetical protein